MTNKDDKGLLLNGGLLLKGGVLPDGNSADIRIQGGKIAEIAGSIAAPEGVREIDVTGQLVSPGLVNGHVHLDKTLLGASWIPHLPGDTVAERIKAEKKIRSEVNVPLKTRATALIDLLTGFGTTAVRSHVDIDPDIGLAHLEVILALREEMRERLSIELVAFPQSGVAAAPGTAELLNEAMKLGVENIGGLDPAAIDGDVEGQLDLVFGLAERYDAGIDIHLHDGGELGIYELEQIAERCRAGGLNGKVTVSHAYALGMVSGSVAARTAEKLARAGVAILTAASGFGAMPPVKLLLENDVHVFAGTDNVRDAWSPFGNGDMAERAALIAYRCGMNSDEDLRAAFDMATTSAARALGLENYGLAAGNPADLVVFQAASVPEAIASHAARGLVIKGGRIAGAQAE
ncbi:MAG: amidohydrolase family protein [Rhodospirillaceae bacterium]|nr:amidohydrolase family protein [Rhodospirillaceae bacterium]